MKFINLVLVLLLVMIFSELSAQPGPPPPPTPITGIEYLVGLGALLGVKKIMKSFSKKG
jgi:hypothetical protein